MTHNQGTITQIVSVVVDVEFDRYLPAIYEALEVVKSDGNTLVLEVQSHLGEAEVRTVAMGSTDGLKRGLKVSATGKPITVPIGFATLGRIFNFLGQPVDNLGPVKATQFS